MVSTCIRPAAAGLGHSPAPSTSIGFYMRHSKTWPVERALTREAVSQRSRAEPGFLQGSLFLLLHHWEEGAPG